MSDLSAKLAPQVRVMQVIVLAMIVVPLIFAGVVLAIGSQAPENPAPINGQMPERRGGEFMGNLALVTGLVVLFIQQLMGRWVTGQAIQNLGYRVMHQPGKLSEAYLTGLVVSGAINEMGAFLNLIAYMASQSPYNLGMGLLLVASNATKFPTAGRVAGWVEMKARELREEAAARGVEVAGPSEEKATDSRSETES